jgi:hypothetical protein
MVSSDHFLEKARTIFQCVLHSLNSRVSVTNLVVGKSQQEVDWPIFQQPRRHLHTPQTRAEMRRPRRELPTGLAREISARL